MISELNGQENYFTRICAGGLLNTRKLELAHMLLQDINMFHLHPISMPLSNSDNNRLISSAITNMTLNDKKIMKRIKAQCGGDTQMGTSKLGHSSSPINLVKSSSNLLIDSSAKSNQQSPLNQNKINTSRTDINVNRHTTSPSSSAAASTHLYYNHSQHQHEIASANSEIKDAIESSIDDLASFTLYSSRKPLKVYQPIKDYATPNTMANNDSKMRHNVSYIELDDNQKLDYQVLQALQNGFTFTCVLNEQDIVQSSFLLNIRLESDNATLVWSRPAWNISEPWSSTTAAVSGVSSNPNGSNTTQNIAGELKNASDGGKNSKLKKRDDMSSIILNMETSSRSHSQMKTSLINNALLMPYDASHHISKGTFRSRSQKFLEKKFMPQFKKNQTIKINNKSKLNKSLNVRRKLTVSADSRLDNHNSDLLKSSLLNQRAKRLRRLNSMSDECPGMKSNKKSSSLHKDRSPSSSLSLDLNQDIVCDQVDANIIYSVSSLTKRYVYREPVSVVDPNEGFLDLNSIKHLRRGCLDTQVFNLMSQQIAGKYAIPNFDHANIINIVYGTTFAENR